MLIYSARAGGWHQQRGTHLTSYQYFDSSLARAAVVLISLIKCLILLTSDGTCGIIRKNSLTRRDLFEAVSKI